MSSSSPMYSSNGLSDRLLQYLTVLQTNCVKDQCRLIELILEDPRNQTKDMMAIVNALKHERDLAGNLAGKLNIEWSSDKWSIGKTDFVDEDVNLIERKLNAVSEKSNFSEDDIRKILQNILISKFDLLIKNEGNTSIKSHIFFKKYQLLSEFQMQATKCIESVDQTVLINQLKELYDLITNKESLLATLLLTPEKISLFSKQKIFLNPNEIKEIKELLGAEVLTLTVNNRAP